MVRSYTDKELLDKVKSLDNFDGIPNDYWILGVRSKADLPDRFDDKFYLYRGEEFIMVATGSTNSGTYGLLNYKKWNSKGAFVAKSDFWHYDLWKGGWHKGKMKALVQANLIVGYRDGDEDDKNEELGKEVKGWFGINFHTVTYNKLTSFVRQYIGAWTVGCQVINNVSNYYKFLEYVYNQKTTTYCLINEF